MGFARKDNAIAFDCFQDVVAKYRICHQKLNQLCASGDIYKGFAWRLATPTTT